MSSVGRPKQHDESTRVALLSAAELIVAEVGPRRSVRAVAARAGTTTRAVYSLFGSKDGLLVQALAREAFEFLYTEIAKLEQSGDPAADLEALGVLVVRRLVREHPALYRIAFQRVVPGMDARPELTAARQEPGGSSSTRSNDETLPDCSAVSLPPKRPSSSTR